ncbi:MAG: porin [Deltaproteobacteria bacterium]|jgi:hypothetical protein|nr:porin [Deltaproteobacteria bacterium]
MNKLLALALGAMLAATAAPAFAASPIEFEGYVKVFHESLSNFDRGSTYQDRESFFWNRFNIDVTFRPNDQVSVHWRFRGPHYQRWGAADAANTSLETRYVYGEVVFPWGTIRAGRITDGLAGTVGGLGSLGYSPGWGAAEFTYAHAFDSGDAFDGITYSNKWDNGFGFAAYYAKYEHWYGSDIHNNYSWEGAHFQPRPIVDPVTGDRIQPTQFREGRFKDNDHDAFGVEASYEWDGGGATLGLKYDRDMTDPLLESAHAFFVNPSVFQSWGPFAIHFEAMFGWGKDTYSRELADIDPLEDNSIKSTGVGFYLDGVYNYGPGDITLAGWYVSGSGFETDVDGFPVPARKNKDLVGLGDFAPFLVAFNNVTLGTGTYSNNFGWEGYGACDGGVPDVTCSGAPGESTNQWGIGILGNHSLTPEISLNYGVGYFQLVKPHAAYAPSPWNIVYQSKDLGWEIDFGLSFQLLDNLSFDTMFGYMFNGKAFDMPEAVDADGNIISWKKAKDTFTWANVVVFSF